MQGRRLRGLHDVTESEVRVGRKSASVIWDFKLKCRVCDRGWFHCETHQWVSFSEKMAFTFYFQVRRTPRLRFSSRKRVTTREIRGRELTKTQIVGVRHSRLFNPFLRGRGGGVGALIAVRSGESSLKNLVHFLCPGQTSPCLHHRTR